MAKLPRTPDLARLRDAAPSPRTVGGIRLHRIYERGGGFPTLWNTFRHVGPLSRFDHHRLGLDGRTAQTTGILYATADIPTSQRDLIPNLMHERGILYAAADIPTTVAEFFQATRQINRTRRQPWLVSFTLSGEVRLIDLTDAFCVRTGDSAKLVSGPFVHAQNWSRRFYEVYAEVHGLYYRSSLTNRPAVVLYERANHPDLFPTHPVFHRALADPTLHKALVMVGEEIGYGLV